MDIAIAGAGIGGLSLAALLARSGHHVTVFDQFDHPEPVGSGLVIQPVGRAVLRQIGAEEAALAHGAQVVRMLGHEVDHGRPVLDVSYARPGRDRFGLGIHRAALFDAVLTAARSHGARLVPGHPVTGAAGGFVSFENQPQEGPFDLIVDACGARSKLSPLQAKPLPFGALWANVDWPEGSPLPRAELRQRYRRADRMLGVLPIGTIPGQSGPKAAIFWSLPQEAEARWRDAGLAHWRDEAARLWPDFAPFAEQITDPSQMVMARYSHGTLRRPYAHGIVHIGDAAHRASPQLGQGANMALLDAAALAAALRLARDDTALAMLHYARARRWHVRAYQTMSWAFTPQYQSHSRALPWLRDRVLFPVSRIPPVPRLLTRLVCGDMLPPLGSLHTAPSGKTGRHRRALL